MEKDKNRLLVATYLTPAEKDWLKQQAHDNSRSIAGELRQLVIEKMRSQKAERYFG